MTDEEFNKAADIVVHEMLHEAGIDVSAVKQYPACGTCGSIDVRSDAWAEWDHDAQSWVLHSTYDNSFCETCESECSLEWKDGDPPDDDDGNLKPGVDD